MLTLDCCVQCLLKPSRNRMGTPEQCQWIAVCMGACRTLCCPITVLAGISCSSQISEHCWHKKTTKSHHYLDYIMGPPTHVEWLKYSNRDVYTSQALLHCSTVWVISKRSAGVRCRSGERKHACLQFVFPSSTGGQTSYWQ